MSLERDLTPAETETLKEIVRQSESYLGAQLTAGIAADQRAMSFVSLLAAATVVVAGAGGALLLAEKPIVALGWTCIGIAAGFLIAMALAIVSARPVLFHFLGTMPKDWIGDVQSKLTLHDSLVEQAVNYNERIASNITVLDRNAEWMTWALRVVWASLATGGAVGVYLLAHH